MAGWEGETWLDVRQVSVLRPIMEARADLAKAKGAQAIEWDNIDVYLQEDSGYEGQITAAHQVAYVRMLADITHARGMAAVYKNLPELAGQLEPYFDAAIAEQAYEFSEVDPYMVFPRNGKALWVVEYRGSLDCADAARRGIFLARYPRDLDGPPVQACAGSVR
ncbi:endo alpha-1,4 polygalactosaminidase [Cellulomonas sp. ATA003]|uniref:endo alpha-1,4 polygalactosaminidase n=1 Tax=Cellulomonas sp. ATA003 TaxID=3073064 RepID=UPI002873EDB9|nr:endo alpha-1,4 polygalactosaminidase [Cellulomonas sp. ATA003]WNB85281.1 endo alpha-1,4 polygalactosaminidase [Cellulomonas sp. ATA003]